MQQSGNKFQGSKYSMSFSQHI
uniref:Uncharacterized protein n=1 Tax=Arundo donax TaxID=35708 RepID=A0A0A9BZZ2_ARUDO